jgi:hypothetical protein
LLFKEITTVYSKNRAEFINTLSGQNAYLQVIKIDGTYSYHWALKYYSRSTVFAFETQNNDLLTYGAERCFLVVTSPL